MVIRPITPQIEPELSFWQTTRNTFASVMGSFLTSRKSRWLIGGFWTLVVITYWISTNQVAPTATDKVKLLCDLVQIELWGPILFIGAFTLQPLVFFPTFLMSITAGLLYGPVWGMIFSFIGACGAATVSYGVGRMLGGEMVGHFMDHPRVSPYADRLRTNTFETILILGLLHAPFDLLNYLSGILRLRWAQFILATMIGLVPGGLPFILFGSSLGSVENLTAGRPEVNYKLMGISIGIALLAMLTSAFLRRRVR